MNYPEDYINKIICGDCIEVMKGITDGSIDMVLTSPPYDNLRTYKGFIFNFKEVANGIRRILKDGGVCVWVVNDATINGSETGTSFAQALYFKEIGLNIHDTMIWNKGSFTAVGSLAYRYAPVWEYMFVISKGMPKTFNPIKDRLNKIKGKIGGRLRKNNGEMVKMSTDGKERTEYGQRFSIWDIPPCGGNLTGHPAPFPIQLANDHIISWSNENDIVYDPFMGSGTTAISCVKSGRRFIGSEISPEYCEIANRRLTSLTTEC